MDRGTAAVRQRLETESPEMLIAIDAIESSNSIEDLDLALQVLCDFYEPLFEQIIDLGYSKRVQYLLLYDGVRSGQASKKAHELVRANTGLHLKPGEFADRRNEIADRDTPGYSFPRSRCHRGSNAAISSSQSKAIPRCTRTVSHVRENVRVRNL